LTDPIPDFDADIRRRLYAASLGGAGETVLIIVMLIRIFIEEEIVPTNEAWWEDSAVIFGLWLFFFILKYVAAYALWYRPYANTWRAIALSFCAILAVYVSLFGAALMFGAFQGAAFNFTRSMTSFWEFHVAIFGLPYLAAVLVGWGFARPAPLARDRF